METKTRTSGDGGNGRAVDVVQDKDSATFPFLVRRPKTPAKRRRILVKTMPSINTEGAAGASTFTAGVN